MLESSMVEPECLFFSHVAFDNFFVHFWLLMTRGGGWTPRLLLLEPRGFDIHRPCVDVHVRGRLLSPWRPLFRVPVLTLLIPLRT